MNGCFNRAPLTDHLIVQTGWLYDPSTQTRTAMVEAIKDPMTKDCQYTLDPAGNKDPKCIGCKWRKNHEQT